MGLFGKTRLKEIKCIFYDGDLPGFMTNEPCEIALNETSIVFYSKRLNTTVNLDRSHVIAVELLGEKTFMEKYKGTTPIMNKEQSIYRQFLIIRYNNQDEYPKSIILWGVQAFRKFNWFKDQLMQNNMNQTFNI